MPVAKRAYRSPIRELQAQFTRGAILDAAAQSFIETGYANTTVKDIAGRAGVSAHTVHLLGTKSFLLLAAVDRALSDSNDGPADEAGRSFRQAVDAQSKADKLRLMKSFIRQRMPAAAPILRAFRHAASSDSIVAQAWKQHEERRYADVKTFVGSCRGLLRSDVTAKRATDITWSALVSPQVGDMFIIDRGWTVDDYVDWAVDSFDRLLLR
jgi:AcrR family transcriptional regulator